MSNVTSLGLLNAGTGNGFEDYRLISSAEDQFASEDGVALEQALNDNHISGVTDPILTQLD